MKTKKLTILSKILILSILASAFSLPIYEEFSLTEDGFEQSLDITKTQFYHVTGQIDTSKEFIHITLGYQVPGEKSPNIFLTKDKDFIEGQEYDYSSILDSGIDNKLVIPSDYFGKDGFYLAISCKERCTQIQLAIEYVDVIHLEVGEKFSFFSKDKEFKSLTLDVRREVNEEYQMLAYMIYGDDTQISMQVGDKFARKKMPNMQTLIEEIEDGYRMIYINIPPNNKITFLTQLIDTKSSQIENKEIFEGEYNQFFMVNYNREECFTVNTIEDEDYDTERDVTVIGQKGFDITVTCREGQILTENLYVSDEEGYVSSPQMTCQGKVKTICVKSKQEKQSVIRISIDKKVNDDFNTKIPEPLMKSIYQTFELEVNSDEVNSKKNIHTYDNYYDLNEENFGTKGTDIDIEILYGQVNIYRYLCKSYPYCSISSEELKNKINSESNNKTDFETLYPVNSHCGISIFSKSDTYASSNHRNLIIVTCNGEKEGQKCAYKIGYHNIQENKKLFNGSSMLKYLGYSKENQGITKEDKYSIFLHQDKKILIDLIVYSGDAFILEPEDDDPTCTFESHKLGSNERRIYTCPEEYYISNYKKLDFKVQANKDGATYYINVQEMNKNSINDEYIVETTFMETIRQDKRNITLKGAPFTDKNEIQYSTYYTIFNPLTCNLLIKNEITGKEFSTQDQEITVDAFTLSNSDKDKNLIKYNIQQTESMHGENKNCLYFVSSTYQYQLYSYLVLPEAKPFRLKVNANLGKIRVVFPYASTNLDPKIYLRVTMYQNYPVNLIIQVGYAEPNTYLISHSKDILIANKDTPGLVYNKLCPIKITVLYKSSEANENVIDFNIRTLSQIPYSIKSEEHFSDLVINNGIQYYLSVISQNSRGSVLLNFKRGTGVIYGRILSVDHKKESGGWNNRIVLPNEKSSKLLKYDSYEQKLIIDQKDTENCNQFCYLIFGVKQREESYTEKDISSAYSLFFRYFDEDEMKGNYIALQNDEFIYGAITNTQNDYYKYKILHDSLLLIDFKSDYCKITLAFGTEDFSDEKKTKIYQSYGETKLIKLSKEEILSFFDDPNLQGIRNLIISIKIDFSYDDTKIDLNKLDMKYKLRVNSPIFFFKNITTVDTSQPIYCDNNQYSVNEENYCDYIVNLDKFEYFKAIEFVGVSLKNEKLEIYADIIDSSEVAQKLLERGIPEWPSKQKHQFPTEKHQPQNLLKINLNEFPTLDNNDIPKLLVRVYSSGQAPMELLTNLVGYQKFLAPLPKYYQLFSADINDGIVLDLPSDYSYNIHFISLYGRGIIIYGEKQYDLYGDYDSVVINTNQYEKVEIKILGDLYDMDFDYDSNFRFNVWYTKNTLQKPMEKLTIGSGGDYIYQKTNVPMSYHLKINSNNENIPFNIVFRHLDADQKIVEPRDQNATELFDIKGYLITSQELLQLQMEGNYSMLLNHIPGHYDYAHHQGNLIFDKKDIDDYMKKNKLTFPIYGLVIVNSSEVNERRYNYIHNCISVFPSNDFKRSTPTGIYLTNHFKAHNNLERHIYKLDGLADSDEDYHRIYLEFATIDKDIKIKFVDDPNELNPSKNMTDYFDISTASPHDNFGVDVFVLGKHLNRTHLVIESPSTNHDVEYSFRYQSTIKSLAKYQFESTVKYKKINKNKVRMNISKVIWDEQNEVADCNYYIRIFKYSDVRGDLPVSASFREQAPYAVYKIDHEDNLLNNKEKFDFEIEMNIDLVKDYYIDILAEVLDYNDVYEFVAYKRFFPEDEKVEDDEVLFIIIVIIGIVLLILVIIFVVIFSLNKKKNDDLQKKVENISFRLSKEEETNNYLTGENEEEDNEKNLLS